MNRSRAAVLVAATLVTAASAISCTSLESRDGWQAPKVVRVQGGEGVMVSSPLYGLVFAGPDAAILMREGDDFGPIGSDDFSYVYRAVDGQTVDLSSDKPRGLLAGKTVFLSLNEEGGWEWLAKATPAEMAALRALDVGKRPAPVAGEGMGLLKKLAACNPHIRLNLYVTDQENMTAVLSAFEPERLSMELLTAPDKNAWAVLARNQHLRRMFMAEPGKDELKSLATLPRMEALFLPAWDVETTGPLPDGLANLRSLNVLDLKAKDLACLGKQPRLEEIAIMALKSGLDLADITALAAYPHLKTLILRGCSNVKDLSVLKNLKDLRWLALPPATTQEQFAEIVRDHPRLVVLETMNCEGITDLTPLKNLPGLESLLADKAQVQPDLVRQLGRLKYLAVQTSKGKDDEEKKKIEAEWAALTADVQKAAPGVTVARVAPICLGSGYILLLVAGVAAAWWWAGRRGGKEARRVSAPAAR